MPVRPLTCLGWLQSGFLWILAFMVGAMGLPALVIFPLYIFRCASAALRPMLLC